MNNGANSNGLPKPVIRHVLMSGVEVQLMPLSPYLRKRLADYASAQHPFDDTPWRKPLENSLAENQTFLDEDDPDYIKARRANLAKVDNLLFELMVAECVQFDRSQDELIEQYKERLEHLRKYNIDDESDWDIVLWQILITSEDDMKIIYDVSNSTATLTEVEVNEAIRLFRPSLSRARLLLPQGNARGAKANG